jgi:putative NIF3 family GTP cyclohydrolase 1 type 2
VDVPFLSQALDLHPVETSDAVIQGLLLSATDPALPDTPGVQAIRKLPPPVSVEPTHLSAVPCGV